MEGDVGALPTLLPVRSRPKGAGHRSRGQRPRTAPPGVSPPCQGVPIRVGAGPFTILGCPFRAPRSLGGEVPRAVPAATMGSGLRPVTPQGLRGRCPRLVGLRRSFVGILEGANSLPTGQVLPPTPSRALPFRRFEDSRMSEARGKGAGWVRKLHDQVDAGWSEARLPSSFV